MAVRDVFIVEDNKKFYRKESFHFFFAYDSELKKQIPQENRERLHGSFHKKYPALSVLEVSTASDSKLGRMLSPFNLQMQLNNGFITNVESVYQASKVFENGNQFEDLLYASPLRAKQDERLRTNGNLSCFRLEGKEYPLIPKTFFYNYVYCKALSQDLLNHDIIRKKMQQYDAFTDIRFYSLNGEINCQARACALAVSLMKQNLLEEAVHFPQQFLRIAYQKRQNEFEKPKDSVAKEINLFEL